ncbi:MAG: radical SAM protein [bacterium]|nr:radical SAM protein [bacterium]
MRIAIAYPPITHQGCYPLLGQNRQFKFSNSNEIRIYPIVPATAATLLQQNGYQVLWLDGINRRMHMDEFNTQLDAFQTDLVMIETKTPIIEAHWQYLTDYKKNHPSTILVLVGDHVSFFPEESFQNSPVDYVITGGDYDFGLAALVKNLEKAEKLPTGIFYRNNGTVANTGKYQLTDNLDQLPFIDRELTRWQDYGEAYLYRPCTYLMSGRGCGGGQKGFGICTFCVWQHALWGCIGRLRSPKNVVDEIKVLVDCYGIKEVFDDNEAGPMWNAQWVEEFYAEMKKANMLGRVTLSSNARADSLTPRTCELLKKCGFRLLKVGLESGNEQTLKNIHKLESLEQIKQGVKTAKDYGLVVLLTSMVGYPWETEEDVARTYAVARELMLYKTRFGDSLQASVIMPYPGTPLFKEAEQKGWLRLDPKAYNRYDMTEPVLQTKIDTEKWCKKMWKVYYEPKFMLKSLVTIRTLDDMKLLFRAARSLLGHLRDYHKES